MPDGFDAQAGDLTREQELERAVAEQLGVTTGLRFGVDIEVTNRCNAKCHFCPRDATPHQGLMKPEVFSRALERAIEYRDLVKALGGEDDLVVSLCGLGEPLLNRNAVAFVQEVREAGVDCEMSTNASLLDERRGSGLLEAGLQRIFINAGDKDGDYEDVYRLPFERTRDNVAAFIERARGRCEVFMVLVDHRRDQEHLQEMESYWRQLGAKAFANYEIMNRGGTLFVDDMQFQSYPQLDRARQLLAESGVDAVCSAPFRYLFVGYDGNYYLCCSDWQKEVPLGSVFEWSFVEITRKKLEHVSSREPICKRCNHDPVNRVTHELRAIEAGQVEASSKEALIAELAASNEMTQAARRIMDSVAASTGSRRRPVPKRLIPVAAD